MQDRYISLMDGDILNLVRRAGSLTWRFPFYFSAFLRIAAYQKKAAETRASHRESGLTVPAFMIVSVTRRCNLKCRGCYSHIASGNEMSAGRLPELDTANLGRVIDEGAELGVSFMLLAGGEPLVRADDIFGMVQRNPDVIFPVFTNGTLIDDRIIRKFKKYRNLIPVLSIEGGKKSTDERRGSGVFDQVADKMRQLKKAGILFGLSFTVMKENVRELTSTDFIEDLVRRGTGLFFYNEYTPIENGTSELCIDHTERDQLLKDMQSFKKKYKALFLAFPGDEDRFGGCLSSLRGFVHIAPDGRLEACPFAPFGDSDARNKPLREALRSPLLEQIRAHHDELTETSGGCALWNRREWAESLLSVDSVLP